MLNSMTLHQYLLLISQKWQCIAPVQVASSSLTMIYRVVLTIVDVYLSLSGNIIAPFGR